MGTKAVKGDQSKFQVEQVSLKPIPVGEGEEESKASSSFEGWRSERASSVTRKRQERESSATRQRVQRETKFEANDEEYLDIKSSLDKLKKKEETPVAAEAPKKEAVSADDVAAKPLVYRRPKKLAPEAEEVEKVQLKPVVRKTAEKEEDAEKVHLKPVTKNAEKRLSFTSSIECIKKAVDEDVESEKRPPLMRKMSFTSSLDNIAIGREEREKVHLSCFSREMGSNVDLVQVCQEQEEGKHEVKLEFKIEENDVKKTEKPIEQNENDEQSEEDLTERIVEKRLSWMAAAEAEQSTEEAVEESVEEVIEERLCATETAVEGGAGISRLQVEENHQEDEDESEEEMEEEEVVEEVTTTLQKMRKAPSIDGLFQRQDVQAAFTFTLPFQNEQPTTKLSLEIPSLS